MNSHPFCFVFGRKVARLVTFFAGLFVCSLLHSAEPARPNILFVLTDDIGYGDLGSYGC